MDSTPKDYHFSSRFVHIGDKLHDFSLKWSYLLSYPLFSILQATWKGLKDSWKDAE